MPKHKPVSPLARRDSRGVISELDATGLALIMRQNAEALFVDLAERLFAADPTVRRYESSFVKRELKFAPFVRQSVRR